MSFLFLILSICFLSLVLSTNISNCHYIYVHPSSFKYNGWYQIEENGQKFGNQYWHSLQNNLVQLVVNQNKWQFYNWNNQNKAYILSSSDGANINQIPTATNTTWNSMIDGSQIKLTLTCSNTLNSSIGTIISSTTQIPNKNEENVHWMIKNEECNSKSREYAGIITQKLSYSHTHTTIDAYYDIPYLSNHSSNITIQISGYPSNGFGIGSHKITYAADSKQYFFMCQITIYIIGDVSENDLRKCTNLENGKIGIMDLIVDRDTFLAIDIEKYKYEMIKDLDNPIQVIYINPDIALKEIQCFMNINWAKIGDEILFDSSSSTNMDSSAHNMVIWKVLIIVCIILLSLIIFERIYFYHRQYKNKYFSLQDEEVSVDGMSQNEIESILASTSLPFEKSPKRSMSVSAASSYNGINPLFPSSNNMLFKNGMNRGRGRAMSMQIPVNSNHPFMKSMKSSPTKQGFAEMKRRNSLIPKSTVFEDEIVPLKMNKNKKRKHRDRYMSVPANLMSDNAIKKEKEKYSVWINDYEQSDFWEKELKILKNAGFENENENLTMLIKYAVKNKESIIDKRMTQSIVSKMLEKKKKANKLKAIEEKQNEKEADSFLENEWDGDDDENVYVID